MSTLADFPKPTLNVSEVRGERLSCWRFPAYFIGTYCQIYDSVSRGWIPFVLWPVQRDLIGALYGSKKFAALKTRQVGVSWIMDAYALWNMLFSPIADILLFSLREKEAIEQLKRLKGMYNRLPSWLQSEVVRDNETEFGLANGSVARAFPSNRGDSYTATLAVVDEADLIPNLADLLASVEPTINAGGQLALVSRVDKKHHDSAFKNIYRDARLGKNGFRHFFIPWYAHPNRDAAWYDQTLIAVTSASGGDLDTMYEQYPETDEQALARGTTGKIYPFFSYEADGNVSEEADYRDGYEVEWWIDPGYSNHFCIAYVQERSFEGIPDHLCVFDEMYIQYKGVYDVLTAAIERSIERGYALPSVVYYDPENPQVAVDMGKLRNKHDFLCRIVLADKRSVAQNIRAVRRHIGPDENGIRLLRLHPRCENIIEDLSSYYETDSSKTLSGDPAPASGQRDHGAAAVAYGMTPRLYRSGDDA